MLQLGYGDDESVADRVDRVAALVRAQRGHDLVVLPELWAPGGFAYETWESRADTPSRRRRDGHELGRPRRRRRRCTPARSSSARRTAVRARRARTSGTRRWSSPRTAALQATYRKIHRFGFGEGEPKLMEAGDEIVTTELPDGSGGTVTRGPVHLLRPALPRALPRAARRGRQGVRHPGRLAAARVTHWTLLAHARAIENQCVVIACNTAGTHSRTEMGGHSQVVLPTGEVVAAAGLERAGAQRRRRPARSSTRGAPTFPVLRRPAAVPTVRTDARAVRVRAPELAAAAGSTPAAAT